jgi:aminopeptidase N
MGRDAYATTHPVVQHVETVEQASQAFDGITYGKGSAIIGMLEDYVGSDAWRDGVRSYIRKRAWSTLPACAITPISVPPGPARVARSKSPTARNSR